MKRMLMPELVNGVCEQYSNPAHKLHTAQTVIKLSGFLKEIAQNAPQKQW